MSSENLHFTVFAAMLFAWYCWLEHSFQFFRPELNFYAIQPWTNVKIPHKVNAALEEVNVILNMANCLKYETLKNTCRTPEKVSKNLTCF